jgi:hypothetical protein
MTMRPATWTYAPDDGVDPSSRSVRPTTAADADHPLDRIGSPLGSRLMAQGTGYAARALPPDRLGSARRTYRLVAASPLVAQGRLSLEEAVVAPWFGQPGGGRTFRVLDERGRALTVDELLRLRALVEVH